MSLIVFNAIDASLAELEQLVKRPTGDLGYGTDLSCVTDVTPDLAEVDPRTVLGIGQAAIRRLTTPRGGLPDDPDYGLDVRSYCNRGVPVQELRDLAGLIRVELSKDDRIEDAAAAVTMPEQSAMRFEITITPTDISLGPFPLIFAIVDGVLTVEAIG